jgi:hypothetical protein
MSDAPPKTGPRRSVRLRVIGGSVDLRDDVPATRAECPKRFDPRTKHRICGHVKCEWHLWMVDARDRRGRLRDRLRSELRAVWLDWPLPPSCGADVLELAQREGWSLAKIAAAYDLSVRGLHFLLLKAKTKLKAGAILPGTDEEGTI